MSQNAWQLLTGVNFINVIRAKNSYESPFWQLFPVTFWFYARVNVDEIDNRWSLFGNLLRYYGANLILIFTLLIIRLREAVTFIINADI